MRRTLRSLRRMKRSTRAIVLLALSIPVMRIVPATGETISRGIAVAQTCIVCHGPDGLSTGAIPSLSGMPAQQLRTAMVAYRTGERSGTVMNRLARGLADEDIEAVARYFATLRRR